MEQFERIIPFFDDYKKITSSKVAIVGVGGVGGVCAITLARSGVANFILCDFDKVVKNNINRQVDRKSVV